MGPFDHETTLLQVMASCHEATSHFYVVNVVAADVLAAPGAIASAGTILTYRKVSNIRRTKSQNLNASRHTL